MKPTVGLVLGSGAARGWAHIGVVRELERMGIRPDIITGASVGAVVAGAWASGNIEPFEDWVRSLRRFDIIRLLDARMKGGGFLQGTSLMTAIGDQIGGDREIADLAIPFACVATDFASGREVWLREGSLLDACRASIALPGIFVPARNSEGQYLLDGGLVNPVPVSLARAMGADIVIAVNLNGDLIGRHPIPAEDIFQGSVQGKSGNEPPGSDRSHIPDWTDRLMAGVGNHLDLYISSLRRKQGPDLGLFDVMAGAVNIMQDRITRSRMAGEPPDIHITPKLHQIGLVEFDRSDESILEGIAATQRERFELEALSRLLAARDAVNEDLAVSERKKDR